MLIGYVITDGNRFVDDVRDGEPVWLSARQQEHADVWNSYEVASSFIEANALEGVWAQEVKGDDKQWYIITPLPGPDPDEGLPQEPEPNPYEAIGYAVVGRSGEYDDMVTWIVKVYLDGALAREHAQRAGGGAEEIEQEVRAGELARVNPYDPDMERRGTVSYSVVPVSLNLALPQAPEIKNPYKRPDHRAAFELALQWARLGCDRWQVSKTLNSAIPRYKRQEIAGKAVTLVEKGLS